MLDKHVLVVGTTADYIDIINQRFHDRIIFLTDSLERSGASESPVPFPRELLCDLKRYDETIRKLCEHLNRWDIKLSGITCFDCESLALAARIAGIMALPYISLESVLLCRNKYASKQKWREAGLPCPSARTVNSLLEAESFLDQIQGPVVIKPVAGSGSEYVFFCSNKDECRTAFQTLDVKLSELQNNPNKPLYSRDISETITTRQMYVAEEFVQGTEYSCDFVMDADRLEIIRITRKILAPESSFGTTLAYVVPTNLPLPLDEEQFRAQIRSAAGVLGLKRAICMLDFIVRDDKAIMIEMTPRPGGDCLPPLILQSAGLDMLGFAIDFAEGIFPAVPERSKWKKLVGLRLFASTPGIIRKLDVRTLQEDKRITECHMEYGLGHKVVLPPDDYDSRVLGYVVFEPSCYDEIDKECREIAGFLKVETGLE